MNEVLKFFIGYSNLNQVAEWVFRIFLSSIVGICIGFERRNHQQIVGIRTLLLISISSTLLGILSEYVTISVKPGAFGDPGRISAAVITGIGFVGGGAIMRRGLNVRGVTTATLIWSVSALGLAIGDGLYLPSILVFCIILICLPLFQKFESRHFQSGKLKTIRLLYSLTDFDYKDLGSFLQKNGLVVNDLNILNDEENQTIELIFYVFAPREINFVKLTDYFKTAGQLLQFSFMDS